VRDLRQWADLALDRELDVKARQLPSKHHEGNPGLNDYLKYVVVNSWWAIWGREIRDNTRILELMCAAVPTLRPKRIMTMANLAIARYRNSPLAATFGVPVPLDHVANQLHRPYGVAISHAARIADHA
jgi:hypothetical protein